MSLVSKKGSLFHPLCLLEGLMMQLHNADGSPKISSILNHGMFYNPLNWRAGKENSQIPTISTDVQPNVVHHLCLVEFA